MMEGDNNNNNNNNNNTLSLVLFNEELIYYVLSFCNDTIRERWMLVSTFYRDLLTSDVSYKWRLERLHEEFGVYHSPTLTPSSKTWKDVYSNNLTLKDTWESPPTPKTSMVENVSIQVTVRFKPKTNNDTTTTTTTTTTTRNDYDLDKKLTLPLHQRLTLIRMNRKLKSNKDALQVLREQGDWFGGQETKEENHHHHPPALSGVTYIDCKNSSAVVVDRMKGLREFQFDHVLPEQSTQQYVYETTAMPLVSEFINGFNATCLVYGQTGSGKTHTMFGSDTNTLLRSNLDEHGIIPRVCSELFAAIKFRYQNLKKPIKSEVSVSYVEIYGNEVIDLLREGEACGQSRVAAQRYVLDGEAEIHVQNIQDTLQLLHRGELQKRTASTAMNTRSSRAHSLFIITLRQECITNGITSESRLFLADLGGSEQLKKSQPYINPRSLTDPNQTQEVLEKMAYAMSTNTQRVKEAVYINLGLLALKQCVKALRKKVRAPYSDSKLTMLLSTGLGGDSKTAVIVCASQEARHVLETIDSMKFGEECRGVVSDLNKGLNNHVSKQTLKDLLTKIDNDIKFCEEQIRNHEKWEVKQDIKYDDEGNVIDVKQKTIVTGAGEYRRQLASLIRQKFELTGDQEMDALYSDDAQHSKTSEGMSTYETSYFMK